PQAQARVALVLAGGDVELVAVPGAGDVGLVLGEGEPQAGLVLCDQLLHAGDDLALADGPAHVRADVLVGGELAVEAEYPDRDAFDLHDLAAGVGERGGLADGDALHAVAPPCAPMPARRGDTTSPGRTG